MSRSLIALAGLAALRVLSLALGLAHPFSNPRASTTVATDAPGTLLMEHALMPVDDRVADRH